MFSQNFRTALLFSLFAGITLIAQDEVAKPAVASPVIWRGKVANLLEDSAALLPFTVKGKKSPTLRAPIAIHFPSEKAAICWDTVACRLIYAWSGDEFLKSDATLHISTPGGKITFLATGPGNFAATVGAYGTPSYFGYKLVDGVPEFHYTIGSVAIRERITFSETGTLMHQHFVIEGTSGDVVIGLPEAFIDRMKSDKGSIKKRLLTLSSSDAKSVTITFDLSENEEEVAEEEDE